MAVHEVVVRRARGVRDDRAHEESDRRAGAGHAAVARQEHAVVLSPSRAKRSTMGTRSLWLFETGTRRSWAAARSTSASSGSPSSSGRSWMDTTSAPRARHPRGDVLRINLVEQEPHALAARRVARVLRCRITRSKLSCAARLLKVAQN